MKFYGEVRGGKRKKWLTFGGYPDHQAECPIGNQAITHHIMSGF